MLPDTLSSLAAGGGAALVGAAATDAWASARAGFARLFSRGAGTDAVQAEETRIQRSVGRLADVEDAGRPAAQRAAADRWAEELRDLLHEHPEYAADLRDLIAAVRQRTPQAVPGFVQNNTNTGSGTQNITASGDIHVGNGPQGAT
jgi:hypothetical protein